MRNAFLGPNNKTCYALGADELPKNKKYGTGHKITTSQRQPGCINDKYNPMLPSAHREQQKLCVKDTKPPMEDSMQKKCSHMNEPVYVAQKREIRRQILVIRTMAFCSISQIGESKGQNPPAAA